MMYHQNGSFQNVTASPVGFPAFSMVGLGIFLAKEGTKEGIRSPEP